MTLSRIELAVESRRLWFCLKGQKKREHLAAAALRQISDVEAFAPRVRYRKATRRGAVWFVEPLFPGYFFARLSFQERFRQVRAAPGVSDFLHFGDRVAVIEDSTIEQLSEVAGEQALVTIDPEIQVGDDVDVVTGPFRGSAGRVTQLLCAKDRATVLIQFLGREVRAEIALLDLLLCRAAPAAATRL